MNEDMEVTVTVTPEDMEFRARAKAAGLPDVLISVYGTALRRLVADEREACEEMHRSHFTGPWEKCASTIRARKP